MKDIENRPDLFPNRAVALNAAGEVFRAERLGIKEGQVIGEANEQNRPANAIQREGFLKATFNFLFNNQ